MPRVKFVCLTALLTLGLQFAATTNAFAHHPNIEATAVCNATTGLFEISYTSTSWNSAGGPGTGGANPQIDILFNGAVIASGSYDWADWSSSGTAPAPGAAGPGDAVEVTALAVGDWDDGAAGGQSTSILVYMPTDPCGEQTGLGRSTGGGYQVRVGAARVTRGLTVHCDLLLSNNLEINWGGNQFT